ncbi:methylthioribose kinase [Bacillus coahuilensis m2-6]|uniref:Methylthioribose kinase n=1 Tax=Bacillus coahuilensis p1.1.43 TaxID=1150625 RepID=A0A147K9V1_9BACI|nr:hypothetical protein [Bacillus coahuilensis]KUP07319.1 methylthioribose kinase [Bacillus coahuilensis p1.1.43]KUP08550.1 methylthioribose kinase [Bacillus coahuilensis m2-6]
MIQRFIELGEGYGDIFELCEITERNNDRVIHLLSLTTRLNNRKVVSLVTVLEPTGEGKFQPLYICREGIPHKDEVLGRRYELFQETANRLNKKMIELEVRPSTSFAEKELYYQYLIGILRMNRFIPALS